MNWSRGPTPRNRVWASR